MKNVVLALLTVLMASPAFAARKLSGFCDLYQANVPGVERIEIPFNIDPATHYGLASRSKAGPFEIEVVMKYAVNADDLGKWKGDGLRVSVEHDNQHAYSTISGLALNAGEEGTFGLSKRYSGGPEVVCEITLQ